MACLPNMHPMDILRNSVHNPIKYTSACVFRLYYVKLDTCVNNLKSVYQ